jgi:polyhydroxybutyrate depolymerase
MSLRTIRVAALTALLAAGTAVAADVERTVVSGGATRSYRVHIPPSLPADAPVPVVLVLHGGGGNARNAAAMTGMDAAADRNGFLAVYPNGSGFLRDRLLTWNAGACCGWAVQEKVDDTAFVRRALDALSDEWRVDGRRVFATGISNGGMMSYRLGCELADRIAAIAPVAGALDVSPCRPSRPVSVIAFHGTADEHVLYEGGVPKKQTDRRPRTDASVAASVGFFAERDGCAGGRKREEKGNVVRETWTGCAEGTGVVLVTIRGGGHAWPGGAKGTPWADEPSREADATAEIWDFFSRHGRPRGRSSGGP